MDNKRNPYQASILGLYGQNGSGKTALIEAMEILQCALRGLPIPKKYAEFINQEADSASFCFEFRVDLPEGPVEVSYEFKILAKDEEPDKNYGVSLQLGKKVCVDHELLKCPILSGSKSRVGRLLDTEGDDFVSPETKKVLLVGGEKQTCQELTLAKQITKISSRSFLFSREFLMAIRANVQKEASLGSVSPELEYYSELIESLVEFGNRGLFVINTANSGLISLNAQPFVFKVGDTQMQAHGELMIPLSDPVLLGAMEKDLVAKIIDKMNIVLVQMVPGLTIGIKELGKELMADGKEGCKIQLVSRRNGREIPLKNESEGIKKIISVLQLLIVVYNQKSITVAIDELDSGIFEYLLGEILRILSEKGKGQLIFTSHNLRPLETLYRGFVAFTTTNPDCRYTQIRNVKSNNNLRDLYYRDIMLDELNGNLYEHTRNSDIALAFREAGSGYAS